CCSGAAPSLRAARRSAAPNASPRETQMSVSSRLFPIQLRMLAAAAALVVAGAAPAQGVLVDKSEIRFTSKQMGVNVDGRFRKWSANIVFLPNDLAKSSASFEI